MYQYVLDMPYFLVFHGQSRVAGELKDIYLINSLRSMCAVVLTSNLLCILLYYFFFVSSTLALLLLVLLETLFLFEQENLL